MNPLLLVLITGVGAFALHILFVYAVISKKK